MDGRDILAQGVIRRIGDGETTDIWRHNWIPRDGLKRPICSIVQNPPARVAQLIDPTSATWNENLVRSVLTHFDAEEILRIHLCTRQVGDFWAWHEEPRGTFSVSSAYRMILKTKHSREAWLAEEDGTSYERQEAKKWSMIWHMQVPSKLKVFVWWLARHSIPTGSVLKHRHMATKDTCVLCGAVDTWKHALISCPMAASVWALALDELVQHMVERQEDGPKEWLFSLHEILTKDLFD